MKTQVRTNRKMLNWKKLLLVLAVMFPGLLISNAFAQRTPWVSPKIAQDLKNPFAGDRAVLAEGKSLYTTNCAPCHGDKGRGDGPAAQALIPKPADHTSAVVQSESDGSLFWKLSEGRNPMPSYKTILTERQRWELITYIRTLAKPQRAK